MRKFLIGVFLSVALASTSYAGLVSRYNTYSTNSEVNSANLNGNIDNIITVVNGGLDNTNVNTSTYRFVEILGALPAAGTQGRTAFLTTDSTLNFDTGTAWTKAITTGASLIPSGIICMWSGSIATIPDGWFLCNGSNGTPDLRDRFVIAATSDNGGVAKTNVTGSLTQSGDGTIPAHTHNYLRTGGLASGGASNGTDDAANYAATSSYGTGTKNIAVYYALAFIMKE
jgi:hypothetical protein